MGSLYSELIYEKQFIGIDEDKTYLEACRWLKENVYTKPDILNNITVKLERFTSKKSSKVKFTVKVFCSSDEMEQRRRYCCDCQTLSAILYSVESPKCETCKMFGYRKRLESEMVNKKKFLKEVIEENEKWNE